MKLRNKITIILLSSWLVMLVVAFAGSKAILGESFLVLEQKQISDNQHRIHEAIQQMDNAVKSMAASWGIWDDTYQFIVDKNPGYRKTNINPASFIASDIDVLLYYNIAGELIDAMSVNNDRSKEIPTSSDLLRFLSPEGKLKFQAPAEHSIDGLIATSEGILMMSAHAIMDSHNKGPSRGTIIMAKYLSPAALNKVRNATKADLTLYRIGNDTAKFPLVNEYKKLLNDDDNLIAEKNSQTISGFSLLKDINGSPIAIIKANFPRNIYQFGLNTLKYYNIALFIYCTIMVSFLWYLLQNLLVKRLEKLRAQIGNVGDSNEYFNNIVSGFQDEVSSVASLYHQATHDPLTGLANRNMLDNVFNSHMNEVNNSESVIAFLFLDIDHFKHINDSLGHEIGDLFLIEVAKQINACLREHDLAVRLGGDEFVVMLVGIEIPQINVVVDRIYKSFAKSIMINEHELFISSSMGISLYPSDGQDVGTLLKNADIALYHAKESGRGHYQYYSAELNQVIQEAYRKEAELQRAIDNKELCLVYQPIYDVVTRRVISLEALLRWKHPVRGMLTAAEIIPIAEKSGLIIPIGKWVLKTACEQINRWHRAGIPIVPIAVNISVIQTKNSSIERQVTKILEETNVDPHLLELELTETSYVEITESILSDLDKLKNKGVTLVVDDFGVGYSGLGYLRRLPVSKLKIDRSFIKDILNDPDASAITLAIIAIAHQLHLQVIAEGVENTTQYEFLKMNDVDAVQGRLLSPPLSPSDCEHLLRAAIIRETV